MIATNKTNIVIIGASGHAKVIIDIIERLNTCHIVGLIDSFKPKGTKMFNYTIIGKESDLLTLTKEYDFNLGIIAIGDNWIRKTLHNRIHTICPEFDFISVIHPNAVIGKNVKIGKGSTIMAGAIVNSDAKIGKFCIVNTKASLGHDSSINDYTSLAPNTTIGGNVKIGTCSAICLSASVIQDLTIGKHTIVGAAALVIKNVGDFKMVYGIPAKVVKTISKGEKYLYQASDFVKDKFSNQKQGNFKIITEKEEWDDTLSQIGNYDFYHTYDYHFLSKTNTEKPILLYYTFENKMIALPLLLRDIAETGFNDATSVYGYAGPISKNIDYNFKNERFVQAIKKYLKSMNVIAVFSRLNPYIPYQQTILKNLGNIVSQGKIVNIDLNLDLEAQRAIYSSRLKTHVNKARRLCYIRKASSKEDLEAYISIYHENMDRVHAKKSYYFNKAYFKQIANSDNFKTDILLAIDNETNEIMAGSMFISTNSIVQYHLSGSKKKFLHATPTKLLIDEMRIIATHKGYKFFNLGGGLGGRDDDSLFDFKSSFSKDFKEFDLWKFIVNEKVYNDLILKKGMDTESDFFPLYRSLDDLNVNM
ncbi:sugar O-acyltransferase (sialic acid O-acetyltransferase NeuD family) [Mariniflexile fucanivorans]|uniref:Sugar O-acyltransferase (Sialic acid O-acetyltransferase NeuD family) n=1 Tax=Mariniflexile fucanivorans TaxID=264023 RepID=A0A4R1RGA9_9FLAO|nr:NeuD/PglB/VioB family sugar acetyltransferase [Mariniflexile fucanivorans]TCL65025.1 sugar O-acyltransferase (sialic acid O-acetyltransferase NeuD family) [Mariniflexile fucanivorans]